jgi:hypothetical protein
MSPADAECANPTPTPIRWLISTASDGVTGRRFIAKAWDSALPLAEAARKLGRPQGGI